ncbi:DUF1127 domain-containing protein [Roseovarius sp. Pro17]|uniref:DUF1127 domain-containing protein n=1 Tax=Roseovarius sp. Pro17 TaxID=3108175 RepID=UPI002D774059|nr:DUF1127 domain-containing protein [Roseovarius sp. Pro17]
MTMLVHTRTDTTARKLPLGSMIALYRSRRALAGLDADALADVGLTAAEARIEARRSFWDMPRAWRPTRC